MSQGGGNEALAFLSSLGSSGIRLGLDRIERALGAIGNPERGYRIIHVAGTNGKGSTCAFAAACLMAQGHRVGLYSSPHLVRLNERFQVNGEEISEQLLAERLLDVLERYPQARQDPPPLTFFELTTLLALWHFAQEGVDVAVLETGLGGRLDATTAAQPTVTAITPIALDHMDYLGNNLAAIAREKAGILRPGVPAAISRQEREAMDVVERIAAEQKVPLYIEKKDFELRRGLSGALEYHGLRFDLDGLRLSLRGPHQMQNAAVALASLELLASQLPVDPAAMRKGLARTRWPGRLEEIGSRPPLLLDGAHNPLGVESLLTALSALYPRRRIHLVFGVLADKDYISMIGRLFPHCSSVRLVAPPNPRALDPAEYLSKARALCWNTTAYASVGAALEAARASASPDDLVLCTGSLFLVGSVREMVLAPSATAT